MSTFGLALGGGGARGLAHIGVLKVLDSENIKINAITGCSMGALIGGLYAYYENAKRVEEFIYNAIKNPKFVELGIDKLSTNRTKPERSILEPLLTYVNTRLQAFKALNRLSFFEDKLTEIIYEIIPDKPIEELNIKFSAIATDLISGEEINFTKGSLREVIKASSAIPGIFPPVKYQNYFLIDGSASESIPADKVKEIGADRVLAVDVTRYIKSLDKPNNIFDILIRTIDTMTYRLSVERLKEADLVIHPDVKQLSWADFDVIEQIILAGEKAAKDNIDEIKKLVHRNPYLLATDHFLKKFKI
jgi:NTE family protein